MFPPDRRRVIVLLTVKSHFSHFYRGQCRDFVISKKLSASVKWDLRAARPVSNVLNHENKIISISQLSKRRLAADEDDAGAEG